MSKFNRDIWVNILTRMPAKSFGRSRCVSKEWRDLLSEAAVMKRHISITKKFDSDELLVLISYSGSRTLCSTSIAHEAKNEINATTTEVALGIKSCSNDLPSCDGLMLIEDTRSMVFLVNPTTKVVRRLAFPKNDVMLSRSFVMYGIGFDELNDDYKIVRISYVVPWDEYQVLNNDKKSVHLYSVRNASWKRIESSGYEDKITRETSGIFVSDSVHWLAHTPLESNSAILRFDLGEEVFREVPAPSFIYSSNQFMNGVHDRIGEVGGQLCLFNIQPMFETTVWVMKDYGMEGSWTKYVRVGDGELLCRPIMGLLGKLLLMVENDWDEKNEFLMYDLDWKTSTYIKIHPEQSRLSAVATCKETIVSPYYNHQPQSEAKDHDDDDGEGSSSKMKGRKASRRKSKRQIFKTAE